MARVVCAHPNQVWGEGDPRSGVWENRQNRAADSSSQCVDGFPPSTPKRRNGLLIWWAGSKTWRRCKVARVLRVSGGDVVEEEERGDTGARPAGNRRRVIWVNIRIHVEGGMIHDPWSFFNTTTTIYLLCIYSSSSPSSVTSQWIKQAVRGRLSRVEQIPENERHG